MSMLLRRYHNRAVKPLPEKPKEKPEPVVEATPSKVEKPKTVTEATPLQTKQYTREEIEKKGFAQLKNIAKREGLEVTGMFADEIKEMLYSHYGV